MRGGLQGFAGGNQVGPYSNMFEGWQQATALAGTIPASVMVPSTAAAIQSTFLHPAPGTRHPSPLETRRPEALLALLQRQAPSHDACARQRRFQRLRPSRAENSFGHLPKQSKTPVHAPDPSASWAQARLATCTSRRAGRPGSRCRAAASTLWRPAPAVTPAAASPSRCSRVPRQTPLHR